MRLYSNYIKLINFWPPFIGAGIRVTDVSADHRSIDVELKMRFWNRNIVGVHFGGSLYAMCDPFFMLIVMKQLGPDYIVWDKAATIRFRRPGRGVVKARFSISAEKISQIAQEADQSYKVEPIFSTVITDQSGEVVAEVDKTLYVRRKDRLFKSRSKNSAWR